MSPSHISTLTLLQYLMFALFSILAWLTGTNAHLAAFMHGMFCENGTQPGVVDLNNNVPVNPMFQLTYSEWFLNNITGCLNNPPLEGVFLYIPSGGNFTAQIATSQGQTALSWNGKYSSPYLDGNWWPPNNPYYWKNKTTPCIESPNMHTENETMAAGTSFAIAYKSSIYEVTLEDFVVFTIVYNSPWLCNTVYYVPANMPLCPPGGCICVWNWIPNGCGEPNMYMEPFRCKVTNSTNTKPLPPSVPPVWCEDDPGACIVGPKQITVWNQQERNNVVVTGFDLSGSNKSPSYNAKMGFYDGAQNDIFNTPQPASALKARDIAPTSTNAPTKTPTDVPTTATDDPTNAPSGTSNGKKSRADISSHRRHSRLLNFREAEKRSW